MRLVHSLERSLWLAAGGKETSCPGKRWWDLNWGHSKKDSEKSLESRYILEANRSYLQNGRTESLGGVNVRSEGGNR